MGLQTKELRRLAARQGMLAVSGSNFSGRTELLRRATGLVHDGSEDDGNGGRGIYVGPEIYDFLSGIAGTVEDELRLNGALERDSAVAHHLLQEMGLYELRDQNPFTLSGGEQVLLVLASALAMPGGLLALDCALEQLSVKTRARVLGLLRKRTVPGDGIVIADNRLSEWTTRIPCFPVQRFGGSRGANIVQFPVRAGKVGCLQPIESVRIDVEGLTFRYSRGPLVLRDACLTLESGRIYTLQGENGAGKSTFAKLMVGLLRPAKGRMLCNGTVVRPWVRPATIVGYHFQNPDFELFETTVQNEIAASRRRNIVARLMAAFGLSKADGATRLDDGGDIVARLMAAFGLTDVSEIHPMALPFALRKRVAMAATLAMNVPWFIMDEPTFGQDDVAAVELAAILQIFAEAGRGVVVICHSPWFGRVLDATPINLKDGVFH